MIYIFELVYFLIIFSLESISFWHRNEVKLSAKFEPLILNSFFSKSSHMLTILFAVSDILLNFFNKLNDVFLLKKSFFNPCTRHESTITFFFKLIKITKKNKIKINYMNYHKNCWCSYYLLEWIYKWLKFPSVAWLPFSM